LFGICVAFPTGSVPVTVPKLLKPWIGRRLTNWLTI